MPARAQARARAPGRSPRCGVGPGGFAIAGILKALLLFFHEQSLALGLLGTGAAGGCAKPGSSQVYLSMRALSTPRVLPGGPLFVQVSAKSSKPGKQVADAGGATYYNAAFSSSPSPGGPACGTEAVGSLEEGPGGPDNDCQAGVQDQDPDSADRGGRPLEGGDAFPLRTGKLPQVGAVLPCPCCVYVLPYTLCHCPTTSCQL